MGGPPADGGAVVRLRRPDRRRPPGRRRRPGPVGGPAYRADLAEVRADGRDGADPDKAATATFFNVPGFALYRNALIAHLRAQPLSLHDTTDLFADLDRATAEGMRQTWRHKFTEGFWRPTAAITSDDGDPLTQPVPDWTSVLPVPPYPEWPSGHGTLTGAFAETVRCHLGDIPLTLNGAGAPAPTPAWKRWSTTRSCPASGAESTSGTPWRTPT